MPQFQIWPSNFSYFRPKYELLYEKFQQLVIKGNNKKKAKNVAKNKVSATSLYSDLFPRVRPKFTFAPKNYFEVILINICLVLFWPKADSTKKYSTTYRKKTKRRQNEGKG